VSRTDWAEEFVAQFSSLPLSRECVYHSPKYIKKGIEKEVCDHLIIMKKEAILISMKAQEDPDSKTGKKLENWAYKHISKAVKQAKGAIKTITKEKFWCDHSIRGKVSFKPDSVKIKYVVVIAELFGDSFPLSNKLPNTQDGVPILYFSVNDFLNIVSELRTFSDLIGYLESKNSLSEKTRNYIGYELRFFQHYISNNNSFGKITSINDLTVIKSKWIDYLNWKKENESNIELAENVINSLSLRLPNYKSDLRVETLQLFEPDEARENYILMQHEICDLNINERVLFGAQFNSIIKKNKADTDEKNTSYGIMIADSRPNFGYVFTSSKGFSRQEVIDQGMTLLTSAIAHFDLNSCIAVNDRDSKNFEVQYVFNYKPNNTDSINGTNFWGHLKMGRVKV
jgi:hypothetical protein